MRETSALPFSPTLGRKSTIRVNLSGFGIFFGRLLLLSPTIFAAIYYCTIATDRYSSEARFIIRTAAKSSNPLGGLSSLIQMIGVDPTRDNAYTVRDYMTSRDAMADLRRTVNLNAIYGARDADFIARYPSFIYGSSDEDLYRYFQHALTVYINTGSGLAVVQAEAFNAQDAAKIASTMLDLGEALINRINTRIYQDAVQLSEQRVAQAEERQIRAQIATTAFRNKILSLDPTKTASMVIDLIGKLSDELALTRSSIAETAAGARNSPQLQSMQQHAFALERQIAVERARISGGDDSLADKIEAYERLLLEEQFATRSLDQAMTALQAARTEARRQQLFLERVVEPVVPDAPTEPKRWSSIFTVFGFNLIGAALVWLVASGFREHAGGRG